METPLTEALNARGYKKITIFDYSISQITQDRAIVTMEVE